MNVNLLTHKIASLAIEAMLYEVSATPKPGLVDRNNCGAHKDMDFFTFMKSAAALHSAFDDMTLAGVHARHSNITSMWQELRQAGVKAEKLMFSSTHNVNTHKGEIFSLGLFCGCAGWQLGKSKRLNADTLTELTAEMCQGLCEKDFLKIKGKHEEELTKGERMYIKYGCTGIRGEAESGYSTVKNISLPVLRKLMTRNIPVNDALVQTLLYLIAETTDTNILSRHDMKTAEYARDYASKVIDKGGIFTEEGQNSLYAMDKDFIERYISPGGCSDLLAVTYFLFNLENEEKFLTVKGE